MGGFAWLDKAVDVFAHSAVEMHARLYVPLEVSTVQGQGLPDLSRRTKHEAPGASVHSYFVFGTWVRMRLLVSQAAFELMKPIGKWEVGNESDS